MKNRRFRVGVLESLLDLSLLEEGMDGGCEEDAGAAFGFESSNYIYGTTKRTSKRSVNKVQIKTTKQPVVLGFGC